MEFFRLDSIFSKLYTLVLCLYEKRSRARKTNITDITVQEVLTQNSIFVRGPFVYETHTLTQFLIIFYLLIDMTVLVEDGDQRRGVVSAKWIG